MARLGARSRSTVEQVKQRPARRDQHLVLKLQVVVEVENPPSATVGAAAAESAAAEAPTASGSPTARSTGLLTARTTALTILSLARLKAAATELIAQLIDTRPVDLSVGTAQPLEHLRRKRRKLLVGDWREILAWLTAELLAQLCEALRVHARTAAIAHLGTELRPTLRIDRAVGIHQPLAQWRRQAFEVGRPWNEAGTFGRAEASAKL